MNEFTEEANRTAEPCDFAQAVEPLASDVKAALESALALPVEQARNATIAARLRDGYGVDVSWQKVRAHRGGDCRCARG